MEEIKIENKTKENKISVPMAIVFSGILISVSIFLSSDKSFIGSLEKNNTPKTLEEINLGKMIPVAEDDRIRGDINAPVKIVEYSDTECPFCKQFHETMKKIIEKYGEEGKVAWVYRHYPLDSLHSKARKESVALECANELGGNDKFWQYTDRIYEITPSNDGLPTSALSQIAQYVGLDLEKFNSCLQSGRHEEKINKDLKNAIDTGGQGTPWSIVVAKNGKKYPLSGAYGYDAIVQIIEEALKQK